MMLFLDFRGAHKLCNCRNKSHTQKENNLLYMVYYIYSIIEKKIIRNSSMRRS